MVSQKLPDHVRKISGGEPFSFQCHEKIACFTHCCRELELALTPYDVLRLRSATGLHSAELLEKYVIVEQGEQEVFPQCYLTMVDDGQASCVFVSPSGCSIYPNRPGACRSYPMGRAAARQNGHINEFFVLLHEPHCHGFQEHTVQTTQSYTKSQGLEPFNRFNDMLTAITQHEKIRRGQRLSDKQVLEFILALYDLDTFRTRLRSGDITTGKNVPEAVFNDDEQLLVFGLEWVEERLFGQ